MNPYEKWSGLWWQYEEDMLDWYMDEGAYWTYPSEG